MWRGGGGKVLRRALFRRIERIGNEKARCANAHRVGSKDSHCLCDRVRTRSKFLFPAQTTAHHAEQGSAKQNDSGGDRARFRNLRDADVINVRAERVGRVGVEEVDEVAAASRKRFGLAKPVGGSFRAEQRDEGNDVARKAEADAVAEGVIEHVRAFRVVEVQRIDPARR